MAEQYVYKQNKKLRCGYTTGTCAAAAAKASTRMLFTGKGVEKIAILTPKGILLELSIEQIEQKKDWVSCAVRKDAGDDIDQTNGMLIFAKCMKSSNVGVHIDGGIGIGRVTKKGLEQPVGFAAINLVPRKMITNEVEAECDHAGYDGGIEVVIFAPEGEAIAQKTFNPRLGINGGISILGTSGIVEPMSDQALIDTIRAEMKVKTAGGMKKLLVTPGNYGRDFAKKQWNIDIDQGLKCSNFIGETIDLAYECQVEQLLLIGHIGKLVKVGAGVMNTHSKWADARMETLSACALLAGANGEVCRQILECLTTDDALKLLKEQGKLQATMDVLMGKIMYHLNHRANKNLEVGVVVFSNEFGVLAMSDNAEKLIKQFEEMRPENESYTDSSRGDEGK